MTAALPAQTNTLELFEKRIRPLLAEKCYPCHSARTTANGGLRLDSRDALRKGGNHGMAIVPGQPEHSLLLRAVSYADANLKMPPQGRLSDQQIAGLTEWIRLGADDPRTEPAPAPTKSRHWAFEPFRDHPLPRTANAAWSKTWIDHFVLAALQKKGLRPAPETTRRLWIRRVTFDLTGLPPTPADVESFLADRTPKAHDRVVDRLLASPHYGERWARHWLDLAHYAETDGHEFDREKPNAWRYRDYVIRALNADLPYNEFIREHIAGDLLPNPRLSHDGSTYDSPLATGFFGLTEERNAADDLGEVRAEKLDNQIDTFGKSFLGLTIACARCHDHKFDPIPTRDYYALGGIIDGKRVIQASLDTPLRAAEFENIAAKLDRLPSAPRPEPNALIEAVRKQEAIAKDPEHPLYLLAKPEARDELAKLTGPRDTDIIVADFRNGIPNGWRTDGPAFAGPIRQFLTSRRAGANEFTGFLTSPTFRTTKKYFHVRLAGMSDSTSGRQPGQLRVSLVGDGRDIAMTADPGGRWTWRTSGLGKMLDELCYVEIADRNRNGYIAIDRILLSDTREPPRAADSAVLEIARTPAAAIEELAQRFLAADSPLIRDAIDRLMPANPSEEHRRIAAAIPDAAYGMVSVADIERDVPQHLGGSHTRLGDAVPRAFLSVLSKGGPVSTRLQLASALTDPANPLTARVVVNRVWQHYFGRGLTGTPDNFGLTGERPSHPELLDTLAARFTAAGWSLKNLHRTIALSAAYRMSSVESAAARTTDPENRLLHHMPVRRLEAEVIRDAILAVSGALDGTLYGPSVPPHISAYQDGRGKPAVSGPIDGAGRRSIYLGVRRNFLTPLFVAFDYPPTVTTIGRRGASTVPSQALILMNNEFVQKQAARWADSTAGEAPARLGKMFAAAFGRRPEPAEITRITSFIEEQTKLYTGDAARAWSDAAHALLNSKEFIFIR